MKRHNLNQPLHLLLLILIPTLFASVTAQTCHNYTFQNNATFASCMDLPVLNAFLHWTYNASTKQTSIAYRQTVDSTSHWVAYAINPFRSSMIGSQALVAYHNSTGYIRVYTSPITSYATDLPQGPLAFGVTNLGATYFGREMIIFATIELPGGSSKVNHLWQVGPMSGDHETPGIHSLNGDYIRSMSSIDFQSTSPVHVSSSRATRLRAIILNRDTHGILNAISWGVLMPVGAMIARYLKMSQSADPTWFILHVMCQTSAYVLGVAGWATGLMLGGESDVSEHTVHRRIGIALFSLGTLQVFALFLRPKKDHKIRIYWNVYHHATGYAVLILSIINIYKGFEILDQDHWKSVYTGVIIALGAIALILELYTWFVVLKRKTREVSEKLKWKQMQPQNVTVSEDVL